MSKLHGLHRLERSFSLTGDRGVSQRRQMHPRSCAVDFQKQSPPQYCSKIDARNSLHPGLTPKTQYSTTVMLLAGGSRARVEKRAFAIACLSINCSCFMLTLCWPQRSPFPYHLLAPRYRLSSVRRSLSPPQDMDSSWTMFRTKHSACSSGAT